MRGRASTVLVVVGLLPLLPGCTSDEPAAVAPVIVEDDAYPVINTFLLALEARDPDAIDRTVQSEPRIAGRSRADAMAAELAEHGGLRVDYFSITTVIGEDRPDVGEFRAKVGPVDRDVTLSWRIEWRDGQWRVVLPPRQLAAARIG